MFRFKQEKNIFLFSPFKNLLTLISSLEGLTRRKKIITLLVFDFFLIVFSFKLTNFIVKGNLTFRNESQLGFWVPLLMIFASSLFYLIKGEYISISKYIRSSEIYNLAARNLILISLTFFVGLVFNVENLYFKSYLLFWINTNFINIIARFSIKEILIYVGYLRSKRIVKVAIYGAGAAGAQLASSLILDESHKIQVFFDDSPDLWGRKLLGIKIRSSEQIWQYKSKIDQILFAIPSLGKKESKTILEKIKEHEIPVLKVPSIKDLTTGNLSINSLKPIEIEDLLGRVAVEPNYELLKNSIENLNICITGSGGSIGKEIFMQIIDLKPKSILLIDSNEFSLYSLKQDIETILKRKKSLKIYTKLGDVRDLNFLKFLFRNFNINVVFHAAAYKHVPLIEQNPMQGIDNNIMSTLSVCRAAEEEKLSKVTLISTDKAVRPTSIMGATKRFAELIVQAYAEKIEKQNKNSISKNELSNLKFSIVRFGNVLGSSGSVVPLFKKQISLGGPITLTDPRIIRYFMTISEAAQLVIQSNSLSQGGDVFILDMGEPVKIKDLAEQMIRLSGLKVKTENNKNGDIEIVTTGLRPGEKLYEELLINGELMKTPHPLIFRVNEVKIPYQEVIVGIELLKEAIKKFDEDTAIKVLLKFVPEWKKSKLN